METAGRDFTELEVPEIDLSLNVTGHVNLSAPFYGNTVVKISWSDSFTNKRKLGLPLGLVQEPVLKTLPGIQLS